MQANVNQALVPLEVIATVETSEPVTVRVYTYDGTSQTDVLASTSMANVSGTTWGYGWAPASLPAGSYTVEYTMVSDGATYRYAEQLFVSNAATSSEVASVQADTTVARLLLDGDEDISAVGVMTTYGSDGETIYRQRQLYDANGTESRDNPVRKVRMP